MSTEREDELDLLLDRMFLAGEARPDPPPGQIDEWDGMRRLIAADASTEAVDPAFLGSLRLELLRQHRGRSPRFDARSVGIAATPALPADRSRESNRRLLAIVAAATILLALAGSGVRWSRDGHPRMNVATAQASSMPDPTPTVTATLTIAIEATR